MSTEVTVTVKGISSSYKQTFLVYEEFTWSESDPILNKYVAEALENSKIEPEDIKVRALLVLK